jgi:flagellar motor component MotA
MKTKSTSIACVKKKKKKTVNGHDEGQNGREEDTNGLGCLKANERKKRSERNQMTYGERAGHLGTEEVR